MSQALVIESRQLSAELRTLKSPKKDHDPPRYLNNRLRQLWLTKEPR